MPRRISETQREMVKSLLAEGRESHRAIARTVGVSFETVRGLARQEYGSPEYDPTDPTDVKPIVREVAFKWRCPLCGLLLCIDRCLRCLIAGRDSRIPKRRRHK